LETRLVLRFFGAIRGLSQGNPSHRFIHFTDTITKGTLLPSESEWSKKSTRCRPKFVLFYAISLSKPKYLDESLKKFFAHINPRSRVFPGNHDLLEQSAFFGGHLELLRGHRGGWLVRLANGRTPERKVAISGAACLNSGPPP